MFGGQGIYAEGMIVAIVLRGELFLIADAKSAPDFEAAGSTQWTYTRPNRPEVRMPYFTAPEAIFDDPDSAADWTRLALDAARRSPPAKKKPTPKAKRPR